MGQCPSCGDWNSFVEEKISKPNNENLIFKNIPDNKPILINKIGFKQDDRMSSGILELDRVLGGGIVLGAVILVGGDPGIGKSTLMLQLANSSNKKVLYVSGEESAHQIRMRASRLGTLSFNLKILTETNAFFVGNAIEAETPEIVIIDSIQTMYREDLASASGSVAQVRESAAYFTKLAKQTHIPIFIVGHVTKDGNIAGPRILEHIVDTVLYFEGEQHKQFRILRAVKNRFGSISEVGIFEMKENGLVPVLNPSELFIAERVDDQNGSSVTAIIEGTRPMLVEIQALTAFTKMLVPRRAVVGIDYNRVMIMLAVLEKIVNFKLSSLDVFVNVVSGIKIAEPSIDLPLVLAISSSYKNEPIPKTVVSFGEIGLSGEVRAVSHIEARVKESEKLGFKKAIIPKGNLKQLSLNKDIKIKIKPVSTVAEALLELFS